MKVNSELSRRNAEKKTCRQKSKEVQKRFFLKAV